MFFVGVGVRLSDSSCQKIYIDFLFYGVIDGDRGGYYTYIENIR